MKVKRAGRRYDFPDPGSPARPAPPAGQGSGRETRYETLSRICEQLADLRMLAASIDAPMVTYLVEMALIETNTLLTVHDFEDALGDGE